MNTPLTFHVRGSVPKDIAHADDEYFDVGLVETNSAAVEGVAQFKNMLGPGEAFDFANVSAGHYSIRLTGPYKKLPRQVDLWSGPCPRPSYLLASRELVVRDSDLRDVTMEPVSYTHLADVVMKSFLTMSALSNSFLSRLFLSLKKSFLFRLFRLFACSALTTTARS